jgi:hypothetical protein
MPVIQTEDLIGLKAPAYHDNHRRLKDRIDIQELMIANSGKIDLIRIREYFALFGRQDEFDKLLRPVSRDAR